ncbi:D-threo-aldose 1-dehydrogenase [Alteromonadaceae bacterium Bs31]|nr:D-threo-aldose 1-dehydrogenase [Alteromonadaceae bacterium Bs31]
MLKNKWFLNSDQPLSPLAFGSAPIGKLYESLSDDLALDTVNAALKAGMNVIDTAPYYGFGLSEKRLGQALYDRAKPFISTKVGRLLVPNNSVASSTEGEPFQSIFDYSYDGVMRSIESSMKRLNTDYIDLVLAHDIDKATHGDQYKAAHRTFFDSGYQALAELKECGAVGSIGIATQDCEVLVDAAKETAFDCFLVAGRYTLLDCSANQELFPVCQERGIKIIVAAPFNSGILASGVSGTTRPHYNYGTAPTHIIQQVQKIQDVCVQFSTTLPAAALQFSMAHPQVSCVVAGFSSPAEIKQAMRASSQTIPEEFWHTLIEKRLIAPELPVPQSSVAC